MWVKYYIVDSFWCANIDKIPDVTKETFTLFNFITISLTKISNKFPTQIFINPDPKKFDRISRIELLFTKHNINLTVYLGV